MEQNRTRTGRIFLISQLIILPTIIGVLTLNAATVNTRPLMPVLHENPRTVRPKFNYDFVISDRRLNEVLHQLRPKFSPDKPPKTNYVDHALRFWGTKIEFDDEALDGAQLRDLLVNHNTFAAAWGENETPLLSVTPHGIAVRTQQGRSTVSHVDHLLGSLAEVGTPLSYKITADKVQGRLIDMVRDGVMNFSLNQREYEWTTLALAFYAADNSPWYSPEGQQISYDYLAKRIMRETQPDGVCYGQHRLYTLTILLRIDQQMRAENGRQTSDDESQRGLISSETRGNIMAYLGDMSRRAYQNQSAEGSWDGNWPDITIPVRDPDTDAISRKVLATGHMLEWWAMAPAELHPPRETIMRASHWLSRVIIEMEPERIQRNYTFLTHAGRALALWRGGFADELYQPKVSISKGHLLLPVEGSD
jgi:hypothetical protein